MKNNYKRITEFKCSEDEEIEIREELYLNHSDSPYIVIDGESILLKHGE